MEVVIAFSEKLGYEPDVEQYMKWLFDSLSEKDKRRYAAVEAKKLPHGGIQYLVDLLGVSRSTIERGLREMPQLEGGDPVAHRTRREGAGRPKKEERFPEVLDHLETVLEDQIAGSPTQPELRWTHLPFVGVARRVIALGVSICAKTTKRLLMAMKLGKRTMAKVLTKKPSPHRDAQFQRLGQLREEFLQADQPVFSLDSKRKERLGRVARSGRVLADGPFRVLDHAFTSYAEAEVVPHGIYDVGQNQGHLNLSLGHDTGQFACASLAWYWKDIGQRRYPQATRMLLLCDCGGSNASNSNMFKFYLTELAKTLGLTIRVAHYPKHCSKYNPIEHRLFAHVERAWSGQLFGTPEALAEAARDRARTQTGLRTTAHVMERQFRPATQEQKHRAKSVQANHDEHLPDYNYTFPREIRQ